MTDLPYGRGGSPLQNLILRGVENTKISAISVDEDIDTGDVYLKKDLNLNGTADEVFIRASNIIFEDMIKEIINHGIVPSKQKGNIVEFSRKKPKDSEVLDIEDLKQFFDKIRMLDGEGYPKAFLRYGKYKLEFSRASYKGDKIIADVMIMEEE